jgi:hypothetical protein
LHTAIRVPLFRHGQDLQFPESSSGQVLIAGLFLLAPTGSHPAVFKKAGRCVHGITAVTPAKPDGIAVFSLFRGFERSQPAKPHACKIALSAHVYVYLLPTSFRAHTMLNCTQRKKVGLREYQLQIKE